MDTAEQPGRFWTTADFLATDQAEFGSGWRYELIDGSIVGQAAPAPEHGAIVAGLTIALGTRLVGNA